MEIYTGLALVLVLCLALWVPYFVMVRRGKARGHTWFTWWKPRGHSDIGPDVPVGNVPGDRVFRQTRPGADDARGARY